MGRGPNYFGAIPTIQKPGNQRRLLSTGGEFHNNGATLSRERFEEMVALVIHELDLLEQAAQRLRFVN
jgi:hypothetical protein